jgi:hypothetical protein
MSVERFIRTRTAAMLAAGAFAGSSAVAVTTETAFAQDPNPTPPEYPIPPAQTAPGPIIINEPSLPLPASALTNSDVQVCQEKQIGKYGTRQPGFVEKEVNSYKIGTKEVAAKLYLNDIGVYDTVSRKLRYDCDIATNTKSVAQLMVQKTINGHKKYVPYGRPSKALTYVTDNEHHKGTYTKRFSVPKRVKLNLPQPLTQADIQTKKYAVKTTITSERGIPLVPLMNLPECAQTPDFCKTFYPEELPPLHRSRTVSITAKYSQKAKHFKEQPKPAK